MRSFDRLCLFAAVTIEFQVNHITRKWIEFGYHVLACLFHHIPRTGLDQQLCVLPMQELQHRGHRRCLRTLRRGVQERALEVEYCIVTV